MAANNADLRQAIQIVVGAQGGDVVGRLRDDLAGLQSNIEAYRDAQEKGLISDRDAIANIADLSAKVRAYQEAIVSAQSAEGAAMRARAEAYAKAERDVEALREASARAAQQAQSNAAAKTWIDKQAADLDALLEEMHEYERVAKTVAVAATPSASHIDATNKATESQKRFSYALLNVSHATQDAMFGFGAMLNNIPLVTQSVISANPKLEAMAAKFGGAAGIAGGAMLAGVAIDTLIRTFGPMVTQWVRDSGLMGTATYGVLEGIKRLTEEIEKLSAKKFKTDLDYSRITEAKEELEKLKEAEAAYDQLKKAKTTVEQEVGSRVKSAIVEKGGGTDEVDSVDKIANAMIALAPAFASTQTQKLREELRGVTVGLERAKDPGSGVPGFAVAEMAAQAQRLSDRLAGSEADDRKAQRLDMKLTIGGAAAGNERERAFIERQARENPGAFQRNGVGPGFLEAIIGASRSVVEAEKVVDEAAVDIAAAKKRSDDAAQEKQKQENEVKRQDAEVNRRQDEIIRSEKLEAAEAARKREQEDRRRLAEEKARPRLDAKAERDAAKAERAAIEAEYAGVAQRRDPTINDQQAGEIGKRAANWEDKGADPERALQQAYAEVFAMFQRGEARLQRLEQGGNAFANNMQNMRRQQGRMGNQRPIVGDQFFGGMGGF